MVTPVLKNKFCCWQFSHYKTMLKKWAQKWQLLCYLAGDMCSIYLWYKLHQALNSQANQWLFFKCTSLADILNNLFFICISRQSFERQKYYKNTNKSTLDEEKSIWINSTGNMGPVRLVALEVQPVTFNCCDVFKSAKSALE